MSNQVKLICALALVLAVGLPASALGATAPAPEGTVPQADHEATEGSDERVAQVGEGVGAEAQLIAEAQDEADEPADTKLLPVDIAGSIRFGSTLGHFFRPSTEARNGMSATMGLSIAYPFTDMVRGSVALSHVQFLTQYGGAVRRYEGRFQDIQLSVSHASIFRESTTGINLSGSLSGSIPTSENSRFTDKFTTIGASAVLSRSFGSFSLSLSNSFSKNFHRYTSTVADLSRYGIDAIARADSPEAISEARVALQTGLLPSHSFSTQLSASYRWFDGFSTSLGFGLANSWTYDNGTISNRDQYTSEFAQVGRGFRQNMSGSISASYAVNQHFSLGTGLVTNQPPRRADNTGLRFPFYDTQSGNLQYTSLFFSLSGSY